MIGQPHQLFSEGFRVESQMKMGCRIEDIGGYRCVFETGMTLSTFRMQHSKETVAFLDVEVNHIAKNAGHINK